MSRFLAVLLLSSGLMADGKFVIDSKLDYPKPAMRDGVDSDPKPIPSPGVCQCGCGKVGCKCRQNSQCTEEGFSAVQSLGWGELFEAIETAEVEIPRVQWLVITTDNCVPCEAAKSDFTGWFTRSGWSVNGSLSAQIRVVNESDHPDIRDRFNLKAFPAFVLMVDGEAKTVKESYPGRVFMADEFNRESLSLKPKTESFFGPIELSPVPGWVIDGILTIAPKCTEPLILPFGELNVEVDGYKVHVPKAMRVIVASGTVTRLKLQPQPSVTVRKLGLEYVQPLESVDVDKGGMTFVLPHMIDLRKPVEK